MSEPLLIDAERPWPGLLPFTEDSRSYFHGREAETDELVRLIEREPLTVLFGQSGLGKSSLLTAGVFPRLRRAGYLPVYLRLNLDPAAPLLIDQVWQGLMQACADSDVMASVAAPGESFWEYLHRPGAEFLNPHGRAVMPVLALDQFEEIFTLGAQSAEQRARTQVFLRELGELVENRVPPQLERELTLDPERLDALDLLRLNLKIVCTFREDYLAEFEGLKTSIRPIMQNRMRLAPMRGDRAAAAIQESGGAHLGAEVAARIVRFVGGKGLNESIPLEEILVEPALLSLVCRELNEQRIARGEREISADLLQGGNTRQIIANFYAQGFAGLDEKVRYFVEDRLLTAAGYRDTCALDNALAEPAVTEAAIDRLVDRRILRREDRGGAVRLELIHDVLAGVAKASRDARRQTNALAESQRLVAQHRRRQRVIAASLAVLIAALAGVSWLAIEARAAKRAAERASEISSRTADDREKERQHAVVELAAADEQLDSQGSVEQQRQCVESTNRFADDPPPEATPNFPVGVWHVDQGGSSTYVDWRADGTCDNKHIIELGRERDMTGDVCRWKFTRLKEHRYALDWKSSLLDEATYKRHLEFDIVNPVRIRNDQMKYDAVKIICPVEELAIRQRQLSDAQQRAAADPTDAAAQSAVAKAFDKLGRAFRGQLQWQDAVTAFGNELDVFQQLERRDPVNQAWRVGSAESLDQIAESYSFGKQYVKARDTYQRSLEIHRQVMAAPRGDVRAAASTAASLIKFGQATEMVTHSRQPQARAAFQEAVQLLQPIVATGRATPDIELQLAVAFANLANESDRGEQKSDLLAAIKLSEQLDRDHELPEDMTGLTEYLRVQLANLP